MSLIQSALLALLPPNRKHTPSGWSSFNAPCCHNRGNRRDDRKRGGIMLTGEAFTYHCFNCGFKAGWSPGKLLSGNTRKLFGWMGMSDIDVQKLALEALKEQESIPTQKKKFSFELTEVALPDNTKSIDQWIAEGAQDTELLDVISYLVDQRKVGWDWYNWHWSNTSGYKDRVILPFYQDNMIVGYTGRKIREGKPKYLSHSQPSYVFNLTNQPRDRKYVIVVEGQFDAIAIDGVAIMTNTANDTQVARINAMGRDVIIVPDRDRAGSEMIKTALEQGWSVSMPPWEDDIKDVADAVKKYGRLYVLSTILHYRETNQIKIQLMKKKLDHNG
jgi:hypothetical protein